MPGRIRRPRSSLFFFFNDTATTEIYTLSLHDALPILQVGKQLAGIDGRGGDPLQGAAMQDRKSTRLNSSHVRISYAVFCLKKKEIRRATGAVHAHELVPTTSLRRQGVVLDGERRRQRIQGHRLGLPGFFFLNDAAPPETYPLPLHGALPI